MTRRISEPATGPTRRRAVVAGGVVVVAYLLLVVVGGYLSPFARRPLLDGFGSVPPYRWVRPPPPLAHTNQKPTPAKASLTLDPQSGSEANVVSTPDLQVSIAFGPGAFPVHGGARSVSISVKPLAPTGFGTPPRGQALFGNVYRLTARYQPGGPEAPRTSVPGQITLFYPGSPDNLQHNHTVLQSNDGRTWRALQTDDFQGAQQASASITHLGYYAVGQSARGTTKPPPTGRFLYYAILGIVVGGGAAVLVVAEVRTRRRRRERGAGRRTPERRSPPRSKSSRHRRRR